MGFPDVGVRGQPGNPSANVEIGKNSEWRVIGLEQRDRQCLGSVSSRRRCGREFSLGGNSEGD
eukprot:COSAG02_NODE_41137_length_397_cov_6.375839_1_plen_62_part_10